MPSWPLRNFHCDVNVFVSSRGLCNSNKFGQMQELTNDNYSDINPLVPKAAIGGFDSSAQSGRRRRPQWCNLANTSHINSRFTGGITGHFNNSLSVFLGCNFAISLFSSIQFSVALSTVFGLLFSYSDAYHNIMVPVCR